MHQEADTGGIKVQLPPAAALQCVFPWDRPLTQHLIGDHLTPLDTFYPSQLYLLVHIPELLFRDRWLTCS